MKPTNASYVQIFDTTLRDGEQSPGASMNVEEKVAIARQLEQLAVDVIEAGFAASSEGDYDSVRRVAEAVTRPIVLSLARTKEGDLERAIRAVEKAKKLPPRWGALHTVTFRHPLGSRSEAHAKAFTPAPLERGGDGNTPNNARYDAEFKQLHGATYRHVLDLADWDRGMATSAPGQSGQPGSPHYADLLPLWGKGEYFPLAFSRASSSIARLL